MTMTASGPMADVISGLTWVMTAMGAVISVVVLWILFRGLRRSGEASTGQATEPTTHSKWLIWGGLALPFVAITVVFVLSVDAMNTIAFGAPADSPDAIVVEITAQQFWWEATYPEAGAVTANEIHIPVNTPIEFRLHSQDVIHSFWVPTLGGKMDALPDYVNTLVLEASEPGTFEGVCAEFCGLGHAHMGFLVVAETREVFEEWLARQAAPADDATGELVERGRDVFAQAECAECHTIRGTDFDGQTGPDLTHMAARRTLAARTLPNEPDRLREWILDPHGIKPGAAMEPTDLSDDQLDALIAYLETLR